MKQIIAMGHGGFSLDPDNLALDRYICEQTGKAHPQVCFLPQASGEAPEYIVNFYRAFTALEAKPTHLSLFRLPSVDLEHFILAQDAIYVGGGNTKSMLALWREWGVDRILRKAWENGVVLSGLSAGAICWFAQGVTDSIPGALTPLPCLGLLAGSCCPHYDGEAHRRPAFHALMRAGDVSPGYGIDEGAALHFVGETLHAVVTSHPDVTAYYVRPGERDVMEQALPHMYLLEDTGSAS